MGRRGFWRRRWRRPEGVESGRWGDPTLVVVEWVGAALAGSLVAVGWVWAWQNWGDRPASIVVLATVTLFVVVVMAVARAQQRPGLGALAVVAVVCALAAALVALVFPGPEADACGTRQDDDAAEVLVVWDEGSGEMRAFCDTVAAYGGAVTVTSVGDDIGDVLDQRFASGDVPELAIVPQPNLVRRYASRGQLCRVPDRLVEPFPTAWRRLVSARVDGNAGPDEYGVWVKGAHKSTFWYDEAIRTDGVVPERWSWDEMRAWLAGHRGQGPYLAPLAVPAEDQWPLTDWFENELANRHPDLYAEIASLGEPGEPRPVDWDDPEVVERLREVLGAMYDLWSIEGMFVPGPETEEELAPGEVPPPALTTWEEAAAQLADGEVAIAFGPSFMAGALAPEDAEGVVPMGFPGGDSVPAGAPDAPPLIGDGRSVVAGGDAAVVPELPDEGCPVGRDAYSLLDWLTGDGMELWAESDRGFLTPSARSPALAAGAEVEPERYYLTRSLREAPQVFFDLSDNQFALANEGDARGTWEIFADFFRAATRGDDRATAIGCALTRLEHEHGGAAWPRPCQRDG